MNAFAALERVETAGAETLFCGRIDPFDRVQDIRVRVQREETLHRRNRNSAADASHRECWIRRTPGSTKATYVVHHEDTGDVTIREVDYDVSKTCGDR